MPNKDIRVDDLGSFENNSFLQMPIGNSTPQQQINIKPRKLSQREKNNRFDGNNSLDNYPQKLDTISEKQGGRSLRDSFGPGANNFLGLPDDKKDHDEDDMNSLVSHADK